jgi:rhamnogalacturonyl hydrolase YesR
LDDQYPFHSDTTSTNLALIKDNKTSINMRAKHMAATLFAAFHAVSAGPPPSPIPIPTPHDLALRMLKSIEERGQATLDPGFATGFIQLGLFWQALAVVTAPDAGLKTTGDNDAAAAALRPLLENSLASTIPAFANVTKDVQIALDRLSLGAEMIAWSSLRDKYSNDTTSTTNTTDFLPTIHNLATSLSLQPQNANGDYWYYNNVNNLTAYRNLTYLDGMYSLAPFITILPQLSNNTSTPSDHVTALESALTHLQSLHSICAKPSGLLVHGYDAIKSHAWAANSTNGASPEVWGRSLAWYSLGVLNTLEIAAKSPEARASEAYTSLRRLFQAVMRAQVEAAQRSRNLAGVPGVWQVVDAPGEVGNFVEASSSFMTVYTLLRGERLGLGLLTSVHNTVVELGGEDKALEDCKGCRNGVVDLAKEIYSHVSEQYLVTYANGSLSLNGTSSVSSLSPQGVGYEYYVTRPREMDSLIGTSAFALASFEMGML